VKFEEAKRLGLACGLTEPFEWVNNVIIHATQLFYWPDMKKEIDELVKEAKERGVKFSKCGHADVEERDRCYMCEALGRALKRKG